MARTNKAKRIAQEKMQAECDEWNAAYPIGTEVMLDKDFVDDPFATKTRSAASIMSGHSVVIWLENISGCYLLSHVTPHT